MPNWKPGDEANGYRLSPDGQWEPIASVPPPAPHAWQVGDVANGHVLTEHGWLPLQSALPPQFRNTPRTFASSVPAPQATGTQWPGVAPKRPWSRQHVGLVVVLSSLGGIGLIVVIGLLIANANRSVGPDAQGSFIEAVQEGQQTPTTNDTTVVQARRVRAAALCDILPSSRAVQDWEGTVEQVDTELGGDKGTLSLEVAPNVNIQTAEGFLDTDTMIDPSSELFQVLTTLAPGDKVRFSGKFEADSDMCIQEDSVMSSNSLKTPSFIMTFSSVELVR